MYLTLYTTFLSSLSHNTLNYYHFSEIEQLTFSTQLNSINDSIEQIKIQANQSRTVDLNLQASLDIDISNGCIVERQQSCQTTIFGYV